MKSSSKVNLVGEDHICQMKSDVPTDGKVFKFDAVECQNFTRVDLCLQWWCPSDLMEPHALSLASSSNEVIAAMDINSSAAGAGKVQKHHMEDRPGIASTESICNRLIIRFLSIHPVRLHLTLRKWT